MNKTTNQKIKFNTQISQTKRTALKVQMPNMNFKGEVREGDREI